LRTTYHSHPNYLIAAPYYNQPIVAPTCELQNAIITLIDNGVNTYQWQLSTNGTTWNDIIMQRIQMLQQTP
jgi:hypothetical protein